MKEQKNRYKEILYEYYLNSDKEGGSTNMSEQLLNLLTSEDNIEQREEILQEIWEKEERQLSEKDIEKLYRGVLEKRSKEDDRNTALTPKRTILRRVLTIAAAIIPFIIIIGAVLLTDKANHKNIDDGFIVTVLKTAKGEQLEKILPDGSIVWLNGNSELSYESDNNTVKAVKLTGESYFDVKSRVDDPFVVEIEGFKIVVLGTKFNVESYAYKSHVIVRLDKGAIKVEAVDKKEYLLEPNQFLVSNNKSATIEVKDVENNYIISPRNDWREGYINCYNASIYEIFETVEYNFNYKIHLDNAVKFTNKEYIVTFLPSVSIEEIIETIEFLEGDFSYEIIDSDIYIKPNNYSH